MPILTFPGLEKKPTPPPKKRKSLRILFVAAEVAPFASMGGLSQVMFFLPRALKKFGHDVRVMVPRFGFIDDKKFKLKMEFSGLKVPTGMRQGVKELVCNVKRFDGGVREAPVYFLENMEYYEKRVNVYGYSDDHIRFALLSRGALEFLKHSDWQPDVVNSHDWHTGYLPNFLRTVYNRDPKLRKLASVYSTHNLHLQGNFDFRNASDLDFDDGKSPLAGFFDDNKLQKQNPVKRGIIYSDIFITVSETYAREMMTPEYGEGLDQLIKEVRTKAYGVLNGLDYDDFDPTADKIIKTNFGVKTLEKRVENKKDLQKSFNLPADSVPVLAMIGRFDEQKGLDLVVEVLPRLMEEYQFQFIVLGDGAQNYKSFFRELEEKYPQRVATHLQSDFTLPRKIFAGADIVLLPSRYEPGGIVALEAMRYGAVPLVRATGGLADSVTDFDPAKNEGTGFSFREFSPWSFYGAVVRALETYKNPQVWRGIVRQAMREDFSWEHAAKRYIDLYDRAIDFRREQLSPNPPKAYLPAY